MTTYLRRSKKSSYIVFLDQLSENQVQTNYFEGVSFLKKLCEDVHHVDYFHQISLKKFNRKVGQIRKIPFLLFRMSNFICKIIDFIFKESPKASRNGRALYEKNENLVAVAIN